jgi:hypothetical protein
MVSTVTHSDVRDGFVGPSWPQTLGMYRSNTRQSIVHHAHAQTNSGTHLVFSSDSLWGLKGTEREPENSFTSSYEIETE